MKLSAESFRELAKSLNGIRVMEGSEERRRSPRVQVQARIPLSIIHRGETLPPVPIMVNDISPRGISIIYPEPLPAGEQFTIQLPDSTGKVILLCTVLYSRPLESGLQNVGAEFTCALPNSTGHLPDDERMLKRIRHSMLD